MPLLPRIARKSGSESSIQSGKKKEFFILSPEWLPLTSINAAASRLKRSGKSFKIFPSYFRMPLLPRIGRKKRFRKLYSKRKEKEFFISSSEWLPLTSMNAAASRLKRSGKSF